MSLLKFISKDETVEQNIVRRVADFLREERSIHGITLEQAAVRFHLSVEEMWLWERGLKTPPARVFYRMVRKYGDATTYRAATFDLQLQIEKYERQRLNGNVGVRRRPGMIFRQALAA